MKQSLDFNIDVGEIANEFQLGRNETEAMAKKVVDDVTRLLIHNIRSMAIKQLKQTRNEYLRSLKWVDKGKLRNAVVLMGTLPNMIESGAGAYDIKKGFEKSNKVKYSKDGNWYLTIPFRYATPNALGENPVFTAVLPQAVYNAIKSNVGKSKTSIQGNKTSGGGLKGNDIPSEFSGLGRRAEIVDETSGRKWEQYQHKTNVYEGITRASKKYQEATQSQFVSFRRAGAKSDPMSWIHKGIKAHDFFGKSLVKSNMNVQVDNSIDEFLASRGF